MVQPERRSKGRLPSREDLLASAALTTGNASISEGAAMLLNGLGPEHLRRVLLRCIHSTMDTAASKCGRMERFGGIFLRRTRRWLASCVFRLDTSVLERITKSNANSGQEFNEFEGTNALSPQVTDLSDCTGAASCGSGKSIDYFQQVGTQGIFVLTILMPN